MQRVSCVLIPENRRLGFNDLIGIGKISELYSADFNSSENGRPIPLLDNNWAMIFRNEKQKNAEAHTSTDGRQIQFWEFVTHLKLITLSFETHMEQIKICKVFYTSRSEQNKEKYHYMGNYPHVFVSAEFASCSSPFLSMSFCTIRSISQRMLQ